MRTCQQASTIPIGKPFNIQFKEHQKIISIHNIVTVGTLFGQSFAKVIYKSPDLLEFCIVPNAKEIELFMRPFSFTLTEFMDPSLESQAIFVRGLLEFIYEGIPSTGFLKLTKASFIREGSETKIKDCSFDFLSAQVLIS